MKELNIDCLEGLRVSRELNQVLSECVKARRSEMSVTEIALLSGKSESTIKRFEQGKVDSLFLLQLYIEKFSKFEHG